jgi:hypothetical protein
MATSILGGVFFVALFNGPLKQKALTVEIVGRAV